MGHEEMQGKGVYHFQHVRDGEVIDEWDAENIIVNQGLNYIINAALCAGSVITAFFLGLFSGNYTPVASDTASSIAANATEVTAYAAGARQAFTPAAATSQQATNSASQASFTFNASVTVYGAFLISSSTINGTSGTLVSAAQFGTSKSVVSGDQILVTYTFSLASS
jgi:hypothetical protein